MKKISFAILLSMLLSIMSGIQCLTASADGIIDISFDSEATGIKPVGWKTNNDEALKVLEGHKGKYLSFNLKETSNGKATYDFETQEGIFTISFDIKHEADSTKGFQIRLCDSEEKIGSNINMNLTEKAYFQYRDSEQDTDLKTFKAYAGSWYRMTMIVDTVNQAYDLYIGGYKVGEKLGFRETPQNINKIVILQNGSGISNMSMDNLKIETGSVIPLSTTYYEDIDFNKGINENSKIITPPSKNVTIHYSEVRDSKDGDGKYYAVSETATTQVRHTHSLPVSFTDKVTAEFDFMIDPKTESPVQIRLTGSSGSGTCLIAYYNNGNQIYGYDDNTAKKIYGNFFPGQWYKITLCVSNASSENRTYDAYINGIQVVDDYTCRTAVTVDRLEFLSHKSNIVNAFNIDNIKIYGDIVEPTVSETITNNGFEYYEANTTQTKSLFGWSGNSSNTYAIKSDSAKGNYLDITSIKNYATTYTIQDEIGSDTYTLSYDYMFPSDGNSSYQLRIGDGSVIGPNLSFYTDKINVNVRGTTTTLLEYDIGTDKWHNVNMIINPSASTYDFYFDGNLLKSGILFRSNPANLQKFMTHHLTDNNRLAIDNFSIVRGAHSPKLDENWISIEPSLDEYAYSFAVIGDTKTISNKYPQYLEKIYNWVADNAKDKNIKFVFGLGDITAEDSNAEWALAKEKLDSLSSSLPYSIVCGDCDSSDNFNAFFPYAEYNWQISGSYNNTMLNTYQKITAGANKYLIFSLDYNASDSVIEWADEIAKAHSDYNIILTAHSYVENGKLDEFAKSNENVVLVLSSHDSGEKVIKNQFTGVNDNIVTHISVNPSETDSKYFGAGMVTMLYFSEDGKSVQIRYYSTIKDAYYMSDNQYSFDINVIEATDVEIVEPKIVTDKISFDLKLNGEITGKIIACLYDKNYNLYKFKVYDAAENVNVSFDGYYSGSKLKVMWWDGTDSSIYSVMYKDELKADINE